MRTDAAIPSHPRPLVQAISVALKDLERAKGYSGADCYERPGRLLAASCAQQKFADSYKIIRTGQAERAHLFPEGKGGVLRILVWNMAKGKDDWQEELTRAVPKADLVMIQEATDIQSSYVGEQAERKGNRLSWDYGENFSSWYSEWSTTGLLTGGRAEASQVKVVRSKAREPVANTAKLALLSEYPLQGSAAKLLVVNIHAINFVDMDAYQSYLDQVERAVARHAGPVFMAGDFNGWSEARWVAIEAMGKRLGLHRVAFEGEPSSTFGWPLDGALVRGLDCHAARVRTQPDSSDHHPLYVEVALHAAA